MWLPSFKVSNCFVYIILKFCRMFCSRQAFNCGKIQCYYSCLSTCHFQTHAIFYHCLLCLKISGMGGRAFIIFYFHKRILSSYCLRSNIYYNFVFNIVKVASVIVTIIRRIFNSGYSRSNSITHKSICFCFFYTTKFIYFCRGRNGCDPCLLCLSPFFRFSN